MGLCKCPKRKVTNQFCFEHRVNVCENCMVSNHPKCVIQSYLQWLQDSDCNPICTFCNETLSSRECCRLTCYHVYHWACLDSYCRNLPESKDPASYECPTCKARIIPQPNLVSVVADVVREKLSKVNWARAAQGLPLLTSEEREEKPEKTHYVSDSESAQISGYQNHVSPSSATARTSSSVTSSNSTPNNVHFNNQKSGPPYSVVNIESTSASSNSNASRKVFEAYDEPKGFSFDHDDNKYQRKSALEFFFRWYKIVMDTSKRPTARDLRRRRMIFAFLGIVIFFTIIYIFSWLGDWATDGDPSYDPMHNPMINVADNSDQIN